MDSCKAYRRCPARFSVPEGWTVRDTQPRDDRPIYQGKNGPHARVQTGTVGATLRPLWRGKFRLRGELRAVPDRED